jgi:bilin biosynthesis protein
MSHSLNSQVQPGNELILLAQSKNDALIEKVNDQISADSFDPSDRQILNQMVVEGLGDTRGLVRLRFAETLGGIGKPATPFLIEALANHPDVVVRRAAAKTLTIIADPAAVPTLLHTFLNDPDTVVQGSSAGALARIGEVAVPALLDILASPDRSESTKGHAAWALAFIGSQAAEYLYKALNSDSVDVRCAVIGAIAHVAQEKGDEKSCQILVSALTDPEAVIRTEAAAALGQINYPAALPHLILALQDDDLEVRKGAATSLGKIGDRAALEALEAALNDEEQVVRTLSKLAIGQIERQSEAEVCK